MRKITEEAVEAFALGRDMKKGNTEVRSGAWCREAHGYDSILFLHGSAIARRLGSRVEISACGYATATTKERLAGVCDRYGAMLWQRKGHWYVLIGTMPSTMDISAGAWTRISEGSDLEQLANAYEEGAA